ncbi:MAG TPA: hypothetical protein VE442_18320 [Jatrophihabitans sp.]|nr:hypothetical protein [Jatrophihabitans sp.]
MSLASSVPSVATVSPTSVTFRSCGDTPTVTLTPKSAGSTQIAATQTANDTDGTFDLAPVTFRVDVTDAAPANTAPSVSISGVTGGAGYDKGSVPEAICNVTESFRQLPDGRQVAEVRVPSHNVRVTITSPDAGFVAHLADFEIYIAGK